MATSPSDLHSNIDVQWKGKWYRVQADIMDIERNRPPMLTPKQHLRILLEQQVNELIRQLPGE